MRELPRRCVSTRATMPGSSTSRSDLQASKFKLPPTTFEEAGEDEEHTCHICQEAILEATPDREGHEAILQSLQDKWPQIVAWKLEALYSYDTANNVTSTSSSVQLTRPQLASIDNTMAHC